MLKKILVVLLAIGIIIVFAACEKGNDGNSGGNTDKPDTGITEVDNGNTETDNTDDEEIDYLSDLSKERYDGYNFRMLIRPQKTSDQYLEEDSTDKVESATYRRNKLVEEMYGITISATESSSSDYETDALNSILAGDDAYDVIFAHARAAFVYASNGAVYNIKDIDTIHLDKPWWSKNIQEACTINGRLYVLDGDISKHRLFYSNCLMFNKRIFDDLGLDYPYDLVRDGDWTFDEFTYLVRKGGKDLDGDGVIGPENDQLGLYCRSYGLPTALIYTGGKKIYDIGDDGKLELTLYSTKTADMFDQFFLLCSNSSAYLQNSSSSFTDGYTLFIEGRAMFVDNNIGDVNGMRDMEDDFGIIPNPKFTDEDDYITVSNGHMHLEVIPITVPDVNRTGAILEALCAIGSRDVIPEYYNVALKRKYSRDDDSEEMLDIIKDSITYDIGYVCGSSFQSVGYDLSNSATHDFSSYYAERESSAIETLNSFNKNYGGFEDIE